MSVRTDYTREELIAICEQASVHQDDWCNRDSYEAQFQVGQCWALLRAGCEFEILVRGEGDGEHDCFTTGQTIWLTTYGKGFQYVECHERDDPPRLYMDEETHYLPTPDRLAAANGSDWY